MSGTRVLVLAMLAVLLLGACDTTIPKDPRTTDAVIGLAPRDTLGTVMTADGMTVYVYTKDKPRETVCYDICAMNWPPLIVTHTPAMTATFPGRFGSVTRTDGAKQLTYNDLPLYRYIEDPPNSDQVNGQDVDHEWFVVRP
jgi:predicted lipoprotein with Yx(FWY)xxD motif